MRKPRMRSLAAACLAVAFLSGVRGDVAVYEDTSPPTTLVYGIIVEDPDPIGPAWSPMGPVQEGTLQGNGDPPNVYFTPGTGVPVAVWAELAGFDHDIAFSYWTGSGWSNVEYLTSGVAEERDPRVFHEKDGDFHVVWWRTAPTEDVYVTSRAEGEPWSVPERVNDPTESARRPSVALVRDVLWVAYERDSTVPGMAQDVVVARRNGDGSWTREIVASTTRTERLDPMLHRRPGRTWLDWKNGASEFGSLEHDGVTWSSLEVEPWSDYTWVGVEEVRKMVEQHVMAP